MKTRPTSAGELFRRLTEGKTHRITAGRDPDTVLVEPYGLDQRWTMQASEQATLHRLLHERYWRKDGHASAH